LTRIPRCVYWGEFGFHFKTNNIEEIKKIHTDYINFLEEKNFAWTMWAYKSIADMCFLNPSQNTSWLKFIYREDITKMLNSLNQLLKVKFQKNSTPPEIYYKIKNLFTTLDDELIKHKIMCAEKNIKLLALIEFTNKLKEYSKNEILEMAESFSFKNCEEIKIGVEFFKNYFKKNKKNFT